MRLLTGCLLALAIVSSPACYRTKTVTVAESRAGTRAWLTLRDQSVVLLYGPQIYGNKLVGYVDGKYEEYLVTDVTAVHVREPAVARTAALVVLGTLAAGGLVFWLADAGTHGPGRPDICDEEPDNDICVQ